MIGIQMSTDEQEVQKYDHSVVSREEAQKYAEANGLTFVHMAQYKDMQDDVELLASIKEDLVLLDKDEYARLKERDNWLQCLDNAGVDNWEGCEYASELYRERFPDEQEEF